MKLEPFHPDHLEDILILLEENLVRTTMPILSFEPAIGWIESLLVKSDWLSLAVDRGKCIGFIWCEPDERSLMVQVIAVNPSARRQGTGGRLLAWAFDEAVKNGFDEIVLDVEVNNMAMINLVEAIGFSKISVQNNYVRWKLSCSETRFNRDGTVK